MKNKTLLMMALLSLVACDGRRPIDNGEISDRLVKLETKVVKLETYIDKITRIEAQFEILREFSE